MSDLELLIDIVSQIMRSISRIERRFSSISKPEDFLKDDEGFDRLDGIVLMLITIGENLKRFEKHGGKPYMDDHPEIDWKAAKGTRDFLSHHYFDLDSEVIYNICSQHLPDLKHAIESVLIKLNG